MNWLAVVLFLELSNITSGGTSVGIPDDMTTVKINNQYASTVEVRMEFFDMFYTTFGTKTKMVDTTHWTYYPFSVSNFFETGMYLFENIKIGFRHTCIHPEIPWRYEINNPVMNGSYDEIFISGEFNLK